VEEAERARKEEEYMRKLVEKKKVEIVEDQRWRVEQEEKEKRRKEKGKGKEIVSEAGPSSPRKQKAMEEPGNTMAKRPKVSNSLGFGVILTSCSSTGGTPEQTDAHSSLLELHPVWMALCRPAQRETEGAHLSCL